MDSSSKQSLLEEGLIVIYNIYLLDEELDKEIDDNLKLYLEWYGLNKIVNTNSYNYSLKESSITITKNNGEKWVLLAKKKFKPTILEKINDGGRIPNYINVVDTSYFDPSISKAFASLTYYGNKKISIDLYSPVVELTTTEVMNFLNEFIESGRKEGTFNDRDYTIEYNDGKVVEVGNEKVVYNFYHLLSGWYLFGITIYEIIVNNLGEIEEQ